VNELFYACVNEWMNRLVQEATGSDFAGKPRDICKGKWLRNIVLHFQVFYSCLLNTLHFFGTSQLLLESKSFYSLRFGFLTKFQFRTST
jgi:hypothetical protein